MTAWFMGNFRSVALLCAFALGACNSSAEMREPVQDASNVKDAASGSDAATRDSESAGDPSRPRDGAADATRGAGDGASGQSAPDAAVGDEANGDAGTSPGPTVTRVFVGGYGASYPVRTYVLDRETGALAQQGSANTTLGDSPTYIAPSRDGRFLYMANETDKAGATAVAVSASGALSKLNLAASQDNAGLVFTSLDPEGKHVLAVSYNDGFVTVYPVKSDGSLGSSAFTLDFPKPPGDDSAQTHSVRVHPSGKFAYVPNKGLDKVAQFAFDASSGKLTKLNPEYVDCGDGPRHVAFDKAGKFAFVMTENSTELFVFKVGDDGTLSKVDSKSALPAGKSGGAGAHVLVHPNDKFVYTSNRTENSIVVFAVADDGKVTQLQEIKTGGTRPRNFDIDSVGKFLIAANQGNGGTSGSLQVFAIGDDGKLTKRGALFENIKEPAAVSIVTTPL
jgi:6-phosphogluconolactonase